MVQEPLVTERIVAGAQFLAELGKTRSFRVAFWLKGADVERWYLYVACEGVRGRGTSEAYADVLVAAKAVNEPLFSRFQVMVIDADAPLAVEVLNASRDFPASSPARMWNKCFFLREVDEIYVYPRQADDPAT